MIFWDLNEQKISCKIESAHNGGNIEKVEFMNGEPIVVSQSGDDNSLKMWIFDREIGVKTAP